jgi:hypothetical protein
MPMIHLVFKEFNGDYFLKEGKALSETKGGVHLYGNWDIEFALGRERLYNQWNPAD